MKTRRQPNIVALVTKSLNNLGIQQGEINLMASCKILTHARNLANASSAKQRDHAERKNWPLVRVRRVVKAGQLKSFENGDFTIGTINGEFAEVFSVRTGSVIKIEASAVKIIT